MNIMHFIIQFYLIVFPIFSIESQTYTTMYLVVTVIQQLTNLLLSTSLSEMEEIKKVLPKGN